MFTKQHYKAIAEVMRSLRPKEVESTDEEIHAMEIDVHCPVLDIVDGQFDQWYDTISKLCLLFKSDNHRFNEATFRTACGDTKN